MKRLCGVLLVIIFTAIVGVTTLCAESQRTVVNLRGDQVVVPGDVPPKKGFVLQRLISVDDRLIVFLYSGPKYQGRVEYAETYNLNGELLEIAWYDPGEGLRRARDINMMGDATATRPARILEIFRESRGGPGQAEKAIERETRARQTY